MATAIYYKGHKIYEVIDGSENVLKTSNVWVSDDIEIKYSIESILPTLIEKTITSIPNNVATTVTSIGNYAFYSCFALTTASFPNVISIGDQAFYGCSALTTVSFPNATSIASYAFRGCSALTTASFPKVTSIGGYAFYGCSALTTVSFPNATSIGGQAFRSCIKLSSLYLTGSSVATLGTNVFMNTPMSVSTYLGYFGSIYVPTSLLTIYQAATYWNAYSARIVGV